VGREPRLFSFEVVKLPSRAMKPCNKPGCRNLTHDRYCAEHKRQEAKRYDQQRGTAAQRGYDSRWNVYSRSYRKRNPLCVECLKKGDTVPSKHTDHIIPVSGPDDPLFWDPNNHQALCHSCHSRKTAKEDGGFGNRYL